MAGRPQTFKAFTFYVLAKQYKTVKKFGSQHIMNLQEAVISLPATKLIRPIFSSHIVCISTPVYTLEKQLPVVKMMN